jgi:predicted permease
VAAQVGLSLLLLIGAGLFARSVSNLRDLNPGFEVGHLLSFSLDPTLSGYKADRAKLFYRQLTQQLAALPGVSSAGLCVVPPLSFDNWSSDFSVEGHAARPGEDAGSSVNHVSPGFFATLKIPMRAGRDFTEADRGQPEVVVVNEKFARHYFGDRDAVGRHIGFGSNPGTKTDMEIIGVVGDTSYETMRQEPPRQVFIPYLQNDWAGQMTAYVRTDAGAAQMFPVLRAAVHQLDANLPVFLFKTEERQRDDSISVERLAANLSTAFGVLATLLAGIGLYGVMAFLVARRTREIGIRMALGAAKGDVVWLVVREVLLLTAIGVMVGLPAAFGVTRLLASQLYGITPNDPVTVTVATLGIAAIAVLSSYLPARRATRVDPITALRYE